MNRTVNCFWWTWGAGDEWPSWYAGENAANAAANRLARGHPGKTIWIGDLSPVRKMTLPDKIVTNEP